MRPSVFTQLFLLCYRIQMLGEYNHSVLCYEQALQAQPGFEQALRRKHAVLCQQKLEQRLEAQHRWTFLHERNSFYHMI